MRSLSINFLCICLSYVCLSQEVSGKVLDSQSHAAIPYVTIQTGAYSGVISNEEGVFIIQDISAINEMNISCMGYQTQTVSLEKFKSNDFIISLKPAINQLNTVYLSNKRPNVDSIIARVKRNFPKNYQSDSLIYSFFYRETAYIDFENLDFEVESAKHIKKAKIDRANNQLDSMSNAIKNGNIIHFTDYSGRLSVADKDHSKLAVDEVVKILNSKENVSLEDIQEEAQTIVLNCLDTTKTYTLKTGMFKIEDSMSLEEELETKNKNSNDDIEVKDLKNASNSLLNHSQPEVGILNTLLNADNYKFTLKEMNTVEDQLIYLIEFEPKRGKATFAGTMYVNEDDYAVLKLNYQYADGKQGSKFNLKLLLGVKYVENENAGVIIYDINDMGQYQPKYIKRELGQYFYVHRPLKFIENSSAKRKTLFDFKISGHTKNREEIVFSDISKINQQSYTTMTEAKTVKYKNQRRYDASIWAGKETLAPSEELKNFEAKHP